MKEVLELLITSLVDNKEEVSIEEKVNEKVVDYKIVYRDNFLEQQLEYGRKYKTL